MSRVTAFAAGVLVGLAVGVAINEWTIHRTREAIRTRREYLAQQVEDFLRAKGK